MIRDKAAAICDQLGNINVVSPHDTIVVVVKTLDGLPLRALKMIIIKYRLNIKNSIMNHDTKLSNL